jgi:hypothetical protein
MSFNVLIIAEDFTKDEFILKPLVERLLAEKGKPNANVQVCRNPNPGGVSTCLDSVWLLENVVPLYPMVDLFLLFVDRDGDALRSGRIASVEDRVKQQLRVGAAFLGENAWQEVEIFILAGHDLASGWSWQEVRADADVKNTYFLALAKASGTLHLPHAGRKKLMQAAIANWQRIKSRCPEDVGRILNRL